MAKGKSEILNEDYKFYWDKIVEIFKARLTVNVALLLSFVTITGFAFQNKRPSLFLLASLLPIVTLVFDTIVKWYVVTPFLYKAFTTEPLEAQEKLTILSLEYGNSSESPYLKIFEMPPGARRQQAFRSFYVFRHLKIRVIFAMIFSLIELAFWYINEYHGNLVM